jgi:GAF domain-containing protein
MRKRSTAGGKKAKARHRTALKSGRREPRVAKPPNGATEKPEIARLTRELDDARDQQTAMSEVLHAISRSKFELQSVLQSVAEAATRLCRADGAVIFQLEGGFYRFAAGYSLLPAYLEIERRSIIAPGPGTVVGRAAMTRQVIRIDDLLSDPLYEQKEESKAEGNRSMIGVPLLRDGEPVVVIGLGRRRIDPFGDREIELATTFAAQAMIAIENARLLNELRQSLEQQKAASEVLQTISGAPSDLEPVFTTMLEKATRICAAEFAALYLLEGDGLRLTATYDVPRPFAGALGTTFRPAPGGALDAVLKTGRTAHVSDLAATRSYIEGHPRAVEAVEIAGIRTTLGVPVVKDNALIGIIGVFRQEVRPFNDKQIELVTDFAAQAVIAIESARLLNELRQSLERQTATSDVLEVISSFPGDLEPVFATMLGRAVSICDARFDMLYFREGDKLRLIAARDVPPAFTQAQGQAPFRPAPDGMLDAVMRTGRTVHLADLAQARSYIERDPRMVEAAEVGGIRSVLGVPLIKDDELIGLIGIYRQEVRPFADEQIEVLTNFAAQAVIAIENARLLNELRQRTTDLSEALEQQTATSEVLQVISSFAGELDPVFQAMLEKAAGICDVTYGNIYRWDNGVFQLVATHNTPRAFVEARRRSPPRPNSKNLFGRIVATKTVLHIADFSAEQQEHFEGGNPDQLAAVELGGVKTILIVPLLRENELIGFFSLIRQQVKPFTDKQIELVTNFAAQAVIAIENARLLNELRQRTTDLEEALEQQRATSDLLQVISGSPGNLEPVFQSMLENAVRICSANFGNMFLHENDAFRTVAMYNAPEPYVKARMSGPFHPPSDSGLGRLAATKEVVQFADLRTEERYLRRDPFVVTAVESAGTRTLLAVPMLKEGHLVGAIVIYRQEVRPFTDKQIELVKSFASQVVIAIENARLLNELRQRTGELETSLEYQTATSDVLKVISRSVFDLQKILEFVAETAARLCTAKQVAIFLQKDNVYRFTIGFGLTPSYREIEEALELEPGRETLVGRVALEGETVHILDALSDPDYGPKDDIRSANVGTILGVPLTREGKVVGVIALARETVSSFSSEQIDLVRTFADQAVIAIENARLLDELRQRTTDLTESLEQQTAASEVLQVISSSPGELEPVFAAILRSATRICEATFGNLFLREGETFRAVAWHGEPTYVDNLRGEALIIRTDLADIPLARVAATKQRVHVADLRQEAAYKEGFPPLVALIEKGGARTLLVVPMLKERALVGAITMYRLEVRPFTAKQIALVENFAAQAVIAIENARLLRELRERTEEVEKLNQQLEVRVADQVGEIERMGKLRRFLPPQVADLIVASGAEKQLESHRREITALFCDLRGFTGFSESADPEDVMALLRDYHAALGEIINKYGGTLERYAGDGVMVVFNDPVPVENPALQAVLMALEMRDAIGALTEKWRRLGHDIGFGIGIAHGFATLGTIGFEGRFDYAAIGTVSNVASRLCDEAKPGQILISPRVLMAVEDAVAVEPVGEFTLKGIRRPLAAYNVLAARAGQEPQADPGV